jgi:uncharacterized protein (TIGR01777 family)
LLTGKGHQVIILSRHPNKSSQPNVSYAQWDIGKQWIDEKAIASCDYIIHLAGAGVADKRWTNARKKEIVNSRTQSSGLLVKALKDYPNKVRVVVCASAIGWYGDDKKRASSGNAFTEELPPNDDFLGETCRLWEESIAPVETLGKRLVKLRTGIVLSKEGGALAEFKKPVKFGVATILGNGKQVISWIHIDDLCRMYLYAIENELLQGVYNAVAPDPVTNKELIITLAQKLKGRFYIPIQVPSFALKLVVGEMSVEILKSATVSCDKIRKAGFTFIFPSLDAALPTLI